MNLIRCDYCKKEFSYGIEYYHCSNIKPWEECLADNGEKDFCSVDCISSYYWDVQVEEEKKAKEKVKEFIPEHEPK